MRFHVRWTGDNENRTLSPNHELISYISFRLQESLSSWIEYGAGEDRNLPFISDDPDWLEAHRAYRADIGGQQ